MSWGSGARSHVHPTQLAQLPWPRADAEAASLAYCRRRVRAARGAPRATPCLPSTPSRALSARRDRHGAVLRRRAHVRTRGDRRRESVGVRLAHRRRSGGLGGAGCRHRGQRGVPRVRGRRRLPRVGRCRAVPRSTVAGTRRRRRRPLRREVGAECVLPGSIGSRRASSDAGHRHGADRRHRRERVLRVVGTGCEHARLPSGHGRRRQRRQQRRRTQRDAPHRLSIVRRRAFDRRGARRDRFGSTASRSIRPKPASISAPRAPGTVHGRPRDAAPTDRTGAARNCGRGTRRRSPRCGGPRRTGR